MAKKTLLTEAQLKALEKALKPEAEKAASKASRKFKGEKLQKTYANYQKISSNLGYGVLLVSWNSEDGKTRLLESKYANHFFNLAHTYQAQKNPFYCGVASMVTVLNALRLDQGTIPNQEELYYESYDPETGKIERIHYRAYSQLTLLDEETDRIKPRSRIAPKKEDITLKTRFDPGLTLFQLAQILRLYDTSVILRRINDNSEESVEKFCSELKKTLSTDKCFILVNFDGRKVGLDVSGHFSVLAAYHEETDSVLVMDAALHKTPWYWIPIAALVEAMNTLDNKEKRGYLIVSESDGSNY